MVKPSSPASRQADYHRLGSYDSLATNEGTPRSHDTSRLNFSSERTSASPPIPVPDSARQKTGCTLQAFGSSMAQNVVLKVLERLLLDAIPLPHTREFAHVSRELKTIYEDNANLPFKLAKTAHVLRALQRNIGPRETSPARGRTDTLPSQATNLLRDYLAAVLPCVEWLSREWEKFEDVAACALTSSVPPIERAVNVLVHVQGLLSSAAVSSVITAHPSLQSLTQQLDTVLAVLNRIALFNALPAGSDLTAYLSVFLHDHPLGESYSHMLHQLGLALNNVRKDMPFPIDAGLSEKVDWLMRVMGDAHVRPAIRAHLEMQCDGTDQADQITAFFELIDLLTALPAWPADISLVEQIRWLMNHVGSRPFSLPGVRHAVQALGVSDEACEWLEQAVRTSARAATWRALTQERTYTNAFNLTTWTFSLARPHIARMVAKLLLPQNSVDALDTFYRESRFGETWTNFCTRLVESICDAAKPAMIAYIAADARAAATVAYASQLKATATWEQTVAWFVAHASGADERLQHLYSYYLSAAVLWKVYDALCLPDNEHTRATLRRLVRELKDLNVVRTYPQLGRLVDLLPIIPDLQRVWQMPALPQTSTWWDRLFSWQTALSAIDSPDAQAAAARLTQCAQNWLTDAVLSACDAIVAQPWGPVPAAAAAEPSAAPERSTMRKEQETFAGSNWARGIGATLSVMGLAGLSHQVWKASAGPIYRRVDADRGADTTPAFVQRLSVPALICWSALAVSGVWLYHNGSETAAQSGQAAPLDFSDLGSLEQAYPERARELASLRLPDLGLVLDQDTVKPTRSRREVPPETSEVKGMCAVVDAFMRDLNVDESTRGELALVQLRATLAPDVQGGQSSDETRVRKLLKSMQTIAALAREPSVANDAICQQRLNQIWAVLFKAFDTLKTGNFAALHRNYAHVYQVSPELSFDVNEPNNDPKAAAADKSETRRAINAAIATICRTYNLILDPAAFIRSHIESGISAFSRQHGQYQEMTSDSLIKVSLSPSVPGNPNYHGPAAPRSTERTFKLIEVVTGQHLHAVKLMRDPIGRNYKITGLSHQALIDALTQDDLQQAMFAALDQYTASPSNRELLDTFIRNMIVQRCMDYIVSPQAVPLYRQAVERFLSGQTSATSLTFHEQVLNGVFCIPVEDGRALILSVDEAVQFHTVPYTQEYYEGGVKTITLPRFPRTADFKTWLYTKVPAYHAVKYANTAKALDNDYRTRGLPKTGNIVSNFTPAIDLGPSIAHPALAPALSNQLFDRVKSDIDFMVFTHKELVTLKMLEAAKRLLAVAGATAIILTGTGGLLARIAGFVSAITLDGAWLGATLAQAHIADRPLEVEQYCREAVLGAVFMAGGNSFQAFTLARHSANTVLTPANLRVAMHHYRQTKRTVGTVLEEMAQSVTSGTRQRPGAGPPAAVVASDAAASEIESDLRTAIRRSALLGDIELTAMDKFHYPVRNTFTPLLEVEEEGVGAVGYRTLSGGDYVQIYTQPVADYAKAGSSTLVVSAHGGYFTRDIAQRAVIPLPAKPILQLLAPHGAELMDPSIYRLINDPDFKAYVTFVGDFQDVNFIPQNHPKWYAGPNFDPASRHSTQGSNHGLMNYHHIHYEDDLPFDLAIAIRENHIKAKSGAVPRADVLVVNDSIGTVYEADPTRASVRKVLEMVNSGELINERGKPYQKIVFCHCRANVEIPRILRSKYNAVATIASENEVERAHVVEKLTLTHNPVGRNYKEDTIPVALYLFVTGKRPVQSNTTESESWTQGQKQIS